MKCFTLGFSSSLTAETHIKVQRSNAYYFAVGNEKFVVADSAIAQLKTYNGTYPVIQNVALRTQNGRSVFAAATAYSADERDALILLIAQKKNWATELTISGLDAAQKIAETPDHSALLFVWRVGQELTFRQTGAETTTRRVRVKRKHIGVFTGTDIVEETKPKEEVLMFRYDGQVFTQYTPKERVSVTLPAAPKNTELAQIELSLRLSASAENRVASLNHTLSMLEALSAKAIVTPSIRDEFIHHLATVSDAFIECDQLEQAERSLKLGLHALYACAEGLNIDPTRKLFAEHLISVQTRRRERLASQTDGK
ncbi:MAG TPA: hypothetical protein V6C81_11940 [Planktothrix sp.]